jgi:sugar lactone lactonase YvrE
MKKGLIGMVGLTLFMAGCAGAPPKIDKFTLFYPPPPELPRIQWLTSMKGAKDLEAKKSSFETFITGEKESKARLDKPYGVAVQKGKIYVCDTNATVMVFDLVKRSYGPLQGAVGPGKLVQPFNISIDSDGNKYVSDTVRHQVVVFDKADIFVKAIGAPKEWKPVDALVYEDKLYVADIKNGEIHVLDKATGNPIKRFGKKGPPEETLGLPTNLAFDGDGILYVSDSGRFQVVKFDRDGHFRGTIGRLGSNPGTFARPRGLATDRKKRLFAVDAAFDNIQMFDGLGRLLLWFGQFGQAGRLPGEMFLPAKVVIDYENVEYFRSYADPNFEIEYLIVVTSQFGDHLVNFFGFGKAKDKKYPTDEELRKKLEERLKQGDTQLKKREETPEDSK